ncbi:hypothetical protein CEP52_009108 [Fusarium oligoseptatum]|uniref:Uncharacterized protein n=1 Tax=Fusarium oligoseptatum TaxID=2604345 RepID=A0A428TEL9_9HYPO|nr:hypothetical protein CEP52_009108 [Fusarium oligoseptatum]
MSLSAVSSIFRQLDQWLSSQSFFGPRWHEPGFSMHFHAGFLCSIRQNGEEGSPYVKHWSGDS